MIFNIKTVIFKKGVLWGLALVLIWPLYSSCAKHNHNTIQVVKPRTKKRPYNPKKHRRSNRTKTIKVQN